MRKMRDFVGFRFGKIHSSELDLIVTSISDRFDKNLLPNNKDYTLEVSGGNGSYYFGSTFENREFTVEVAFDKVSEKKWRKISQLFATDKLLDLVFDELPYKTYRAKLKSKPEFKCLCFTDKDSGQRVYKGEGTLNFICYFPFAYGFDKYIVKAADNYLTTIPSGSEDKIYNTKTKDFYNIENNMGFEWKGGFPTIEQVKAGELYKKVKEDGIEKEKLIDVRAYFKNVPEWAESSQLLTTPTLDNSQGLIYLPQYSKSNLINMDIGLCEENALIGSRLLVYNPGDVPIDFELKLNHEQRSFLNDRGNRFQIRRFNVQRLTIEDAVDWTGLETYNLDNNSKYKYGRKYFTQETKIKNQENNSFDANDLQKLPSFELSDLDNLHPDYCYIAEPIPREKLGYYIKLLYWQSSTIKSYIDYEEGVKLSQEYEELYDLCITEEEKYELYWKYLKKGFINLYKVNFPTYPYQGALSDKFIGDKFYLRNGVIQIFKMNEIHREIRLTKDTTTSTSRYNILFHLENDSIFYTMSTDGENITFTKGAVSYPKWAKNIIIKETITEETTEDNPLYFQLALKTSAFKDENGDYKETVTVLATEINDYLVYRTLNRLNEYTINFNFDTFMKDFIHCPPEFILRDRELNYKEFENNVSKIPQWYTEDYLEIRTDNIEDTTLFLDSEKRMLYNIKDPDKILEPFNFKPEKIILNDNIIQGKWFKIPTGWSLIEVTPVVDEKEAGSKTWLDARPFDWGYSGEEASLRRQTFNEIYYRAAKELATHWKYTNVDYENNVSMDSFLQFRHWFNSYKEKMDINSFEYKYILSLERKYEYEFLKDIQMYWKQLKGTEITKGNIKITLNGSIDEWWWYACNYMWENFPPLYWGYADILNTAQIKYTPLFY